MKRYQFGIKMEGSVIELEMRVRSNKSYKPVYYVKHESDGDVSRETISDAIADLREWALKQYPTVDSSVEHSE